MNFHHLISKLEIAAKKSLYFADQEREKSLQGAYFPFTVRHPRSLTRENFFRERYCAILAIIEKIKEMGEDEEREQEEIIYIARRLIAEITYPWIKRKTLDEGLYKEVYKDKTFEPYVKNLSHHKELMLHSGIDSLGLGNELEKELYEALLHRVPQKERNEYSFCVADIVLIESELQNLFLDEWTKKANLIRFRLYEFGLLEKGKVV